jgi:diacylglycerol kinase family enzyme
MAGEEAIRLLVSVLGAVLFAVVVVLLLRLGDVLANRVSARVPRTGNAADRRPEGQGAVAGVRVQSATGAQERGEPDEDARPLAAVIVNPTKFSDVAPVRTLVTKVCVDLGGQEPLWLPTTADDPGIGQAKEALGSGAHVVMACGGDGTVRTVAEALAGTGVPLGLIPAGTGNLLARNLDMNLDDMGAATRVALAGDDRAVDVGRITIDDGSGPGEEQVFLVMAGMGFDATIMATAPEALKAKVGPVAYTVAGLRNLKGRQARVRLAVDDRPEFQRRVRTIVVGNCGKLLGGLVLMPDAEIDDGWLDAVSIAPQGIVGWLAVAARVITRQRRGHRRVEHWRAQAITIASEQPEPAQLDGDPVGEVLAMRIRVDPGALLVRVPHRR